MSFASGDDGGPRRPYEEIKDIVEKVGWFLVVAAAAVGLHFLTDFFSSIAIPFFIISLLRFLEDVMFVCDFLVFFVYVVMTSALSVHRLLLVVGINVPALVRRFFWPPKS